MTVRSLRVLTYHHIGSPDAAVCCPSTLSATPQGFARHVRLLARHYRVVSLAEVLEALGGGRALPARAVLITFDDACRDFADVAWPVLRRHGLPATVFVPTAYPGRPELPFWWDRLHAALATTARPTLDTPAGRLRLDSPSARRASLKALQRSIKTTPHAQAMALVEDVCAALGETTPVPSDVLSWSELRALAADGVDLGAHTHTHPALTQLSRDEAREEIRRSRDCLTRELGTPPAAFAYPFGDHDAEVVSLVREAGFALALSCEDGHSRLPGDDPLRLCRTNVTPRTTAAVLRLRLTEVGARLDRWRHGRRPQPVSAAGGTAPGADAPRVAYIMSRFPKLSETFVLNEMRSVAALGIPIEVYPLRRERQRVTHPEVAEWVARAHYERLLSASVLRAQLDALRTQPRTYLRVAAQVIRETWGGRPKAFLGAVAAFPRAVRFAADMQARGVTHVHAHFANHPTVAAYVIHRLAGIPFSFTAHGSDLHVDRRMLGTKLSAAAFAVTVSQFNKDVMVQACGARASHRIHVIHCGIDPELFAPRADCNRIGFRIVCVASLEEVKGHAYLVEACRILRDRGGEFTCELVGEGPCRPAIERQIAGHALGERVRLLGGQPRSEVARLLAAADVAVLASHPTPQGKREGLPVALVEAMASGAAVVATAISGIPELVEAERSGLLVPSGDAVALAEALERLARDPDLRERLGRAGRETVLRDFCQDASAAALVRLFRSEAPRAAEERCAPPSAARQIA